MGRSLGREEFANLLKAGHILFKLMEGRDIAYEMVRKFVDNNFSVYKGLREDLESLKELVGSLSDYNNQRKREIVEYIDAVNEKLLKSEGLTGDLFLLFLLFWNMNRFKDCELKKEQLFSYARNFTEIRSIYEEYRPKFEGKKIVDLDEEEGWKTVKELLEKLNKKIKFRKKEGACFDDTCLSENTGNTVNGKSCQEEYVGAFKIGHILFPEIVIPLDNPIAESLGIKSQYESWKLDRHYGMFWKAIRNKILEFRDIAEIEGSSVLKAIDELLYVFFSLTRKKKDFIQEVFCLDNNGLDDSSLEEIGKKISEDVQKEVGNCFEGIKVWRWNGVVNVSLDIREGLKSILTQNCGKEIGKEYLVGKYNNGIRIGTSLDSNIVEKACLVALAFHTGKIIGKEEGRKEKR